MIEPWVTGVCSQELQDKIAASAVQGESRYK